MSSRSAYFTEARRLWDLALPMVLSQVGVMMLTVVDSMMLGHYDSHALAAAVLGNTWIAGTKIVGMGVVFGMDPLVSRAHGARDAARAGLALQQGLIAAILVSVPIILLWCLTEDVLGALGQDPSVAASAHRYVVIQAPAVPAFLAFTALRAYLQCRGIMYPVMWLVFASNALNAALNWALIFGNAGLPELGLSGAALATTLVQFALLGGVVLVIRYLRLQRGAWTGWRREALSRERVGEVLGLGVPVGIQLGLEIWAFTFAAFWAGELGSAQLASHGIVLNMAALSFMVPLGVSIAAVTRVGNLIGAGAPDQAQRSAWTAFALGGAVMLVSAAVFVIFRWELPRLFTDDPELVSRCASILPVAATFQIFDGLQVVGCGILRGMGRTRPAAVFNFIGYYVLGLPTARILAFGLGVGLAGLWWGLCVGLATVAVLLIAWVAVRGPATVRA